MDKLDALDLYAFHKSDQMTDNQWSLKTIKIDIERIAALLNRLLTPFGCCSLVPFMREYVRENNIDRKQVI